MGGGANCPMDPHPLQFTLIQTGTMEEAIFRYSLTTLLNPFLESHSVQIRGPPVVTGSMCPAGPANSSSLTVTAVIDTVCTYSEFWESLTGADGDAGHLWD